MHESRGIERVVDLSRGRELLPMQSSMGFHLAGPDGTKLAGNVPAHAFESGWSVVSGHRAGHEHRHRHLPFPDGAAGREHELSLGKSLGPLTEMRDVAGHCLLLMFAVTTVLALLCAAWISPGCAAARTAGRARSIGWRAGTSPSACRSPAPRTDIDDMALTVNAALERLSPATSTRCARSAPTSRTT